MTPFPPHGYVIQESINAPIFSIDWSIAVSRSNIGCLSQVPYLSWHRPMLKICVLAGASMACIAQTSTWVWHRKAHNHKYIKNSCRRHWWPYQLVHIPTGYTNWRNIAAMSIARSPEHVFTPLLSSHTSIEHAHKRCGQTLYTRLTLVGPSSCSLWFTCDCELYDVTLSRWSWRSDIIALL